MKRREKLALKFMIVASKFENPISSGWWTVPMVNPKKKKHEQKWIICAHGIAMSVWLGKNKAMIANDLKCYSMISIVVESLFLLMLLLWLLLLWLVCNGEWSEISMNVRDWVEECARVVLFIISPFNMQAKYIHWKWMNI